MGRESNLKNRFLCRKDNLQPLSQNEFEWVIEALLRHHCKARRSIHFVLIPVAPLNLLY